MRKFLAGVFVLITTLAFESSLFAQGCAMCRTALESSPEGKVLAASLAHGILLLLFLPYAILGTIAFVVYRAYRKKSRDSVTHYANYSSQSL